MLEIDKETVQCIADNLLQWAVFSVEGLTLMDFLNFYLRDNQKLNRDEFTKLSDIVQSLVDEGYLKVVIRKNGSVFYVKKEVQRWGY